MLLNEIFVTKDLVAKKTSCKSGDESSKKCQFLEPSNLKF